MTSSKRSVESQRHDPEFFQDRCLGKRTAALLRAQGWVIWRVADEFPNDAQEIGDPEWIAHGLQRGWGLLTTDKRIRYQTDERGALAAGSGVMFRLSSGNLTINQQAARFERHRRSIWAKVHQGGPALYTVYDDDVKLAWPKPRMPG